MGLSDIYMHQGFVYDFILPSLRLKSKRGHTSTTSTTTQREQFFEITQSLFWTLETTSGTAGNQA